MNTRRPTDPTIPRLTGRKPRVRRKLARVLRAIERATPAAPILNAPQWRTFVAEGLRLAPSLPPLAFALAARGRPDFPFDPVTVHDGRFGVAAGAATATQYHRPATGRPWPRRVLRGAVEARATLDALNRWAAAILAE